MFYFNTVIENTWIHVVAKEPLFVGQT